MVDPNKIWALVGCLYLLFYMLCGTFFFISARRMKMPTLVTTYAAFKNCVC